MPTISPGKRYWRARIIKARLAYDEWVRKHEPHGAPADQWELWRAWVAARRAGFNRERDLLYGTQRRDRTAYLNGLNSDATGRD